MAMLLLAGSFLLVAAVATALRAHRRQREYHRQVGERLDIVASEWPDDRLRFISRRGEPWR
jgi:hypothetical protein